MNKRGQIALFVIIGILLVALIVLIYAFKPQFLGIALSSEDAQKLVTSQVEPLRDFTDTCMLIAAQRTLNTMGRQGGYVIPKTNHFSIPPIMADAPIINYALFYDPDKGYVNELPSLNTLKNELADYLENSIDFSTCIDNYSPFEDLIDVEIINTLPTVNREEIDIGEKSGQIVIPFTYPVQISKQNASTLVENYELIIPLNLARIRETAARIVNEVSIGNNYMDVISEEGNIEWEQVRENANAEKLLITAEVYTSPFTDLVGDTYNEKNILFKIEYQNKGLATPYNFYFLIGQP